MGISVQVHLVYVLGGVPPELGGMPLGTYPEGTCPKVERTYDDTRTLHVCALCSRDPIVTRWANFVRIFLRLILNETDPYISVHMCIPFHQRDTPHNERMPEITRAFAIIHR